MSSGCKELKFKAHQFIEFVFVHPFIDFVNKAVNGFDEGFFCRVMETSQDLLLQFAIL